MAAIDNTDSQQKELRQEFDKVVNMSPSELSTWLETEESKAVGQVNEGDSESIGHKSGHRIITILKKKASDLTNDDYEHISKVVSYVKRHSAQRPAHVDGSNWEYSLKNWGHDPQKK